MRIVNLANRMDIFLIKPVGCGFPRTPWSGLQWRKIAPVWLKSKKILGDKPSDKPSVWKPGLYSGVGSDSENLRWSGLPDVVGGSATIVLCSNYQPSKKAWLFFFVRFQLVLRELSIIQATYQTVFYSGGLQLIALTAHSVGVISESS